MLFMIAVIVVIVEAGKESAYADDMYAVTAVNAEIAEKLVSFDSSTAFREYIHGLEVKLPTAKIQSPASYLVKEGSGLISDATLACSSYIVVVAFDKNNKRIPLTQNNVDSYTITLGEEKPAPPAIDMDSTGYIKIRVDHSVWGAKLCAAPPTTSFSVNLLKKADDSVVGKFTGQTFEPKDSMVKILYVPRPLKVDELSSPDMIYPDFLKTMSGTVEFKTTFGTPDQRQIGCESAFFARPFHRLNGKALTWQEAGFQSIDIYNKDIKLGSIDLANDTSLVIPIYAKSQSSNKFGPAICKDIHADEVHLALVSRSTNTLNYYLQKKGRWSAYQSALDVDGLWLPTGIFATNFDKTAEGLQFSAFPISLALGYRYFDKDGSSYNGFSLALSWSIIGNSGATGADNNAASSLKGAALGLLWDIDSTVYFLVGYDKSFATGVQSPGLTFGIGLGPKLISKFTGK